VRSVKRAVAVVENCGSVAMDSFASYGGTRTEVGWAGSVVGALS
jgi:hypothetical protein